MSTGPSDSLIAFKVLCLADDLSVTDRRVGAALIDHFNRTTGRCDPSIGTIAALLNVNRRTVMRSILSLAAKGYMSRIRHGGYFHRNSYTPAWATMRAKELAWKARRRPRSPRPGEATASPLEGQGCHLDDVATATQTCLTNQSEETFGVAAPSEASIVVPRGEPASGPTMGRAKVSNSNLRDRQVSCSPIPNSGQAAFDSAERRWTTELTKTLVPHEQLFAKALDAIDDSMRAAATAAELKTRGSGMRLILQQLAYLSFPTKGPGK